MGLDLAALLAAAGICAQIFFIDLLLSADNAVMIALASRSLPPTQARQAAVLGTAGAVVLRIGMAAVVLYLLQVPFLRIVAAATLLVLAVRLTLEQGPAVPDLQRRATVISAVGAIIIADAVMSLDNVVAIAAVAQGSLLLMGFGLAMSIPMLIYGSALIRAFIEDNRFLVAAGGMFLGWVAGQIGVSDPVVAPWIDASAPALPLVVPAVCAIFVLWESRILTGASIPASGGNVDAG